MSFAEKLKTAREWFAENDVPEIVEIDTDELEHAFAAIMGHRATDAERAAGLWRLIAEAQKE